MKTPVDPHWIRTAADKTAIAQGCYFDEEKGKRIIEFIERFICYHTGDPKLVGTPVKLLDWQKDFISRLFGWQRPDNTRRFRSANVWIAKKCGKTTLAAWLCIVLLVADQEYGAEVYSLANARDQARQIYQEIKKICLYSPLLRKHLECTDTGGRIIFPKTSSFYRVLANNPAALEGINASALVFDELHRQTHDDLFDTVRWAGSARRQPLFLTISTAGIFDPSAIGYRVYQKGKEILAGIDDQTIDVLPVIFEIDKEDEWRTENPDCESIWKKANPSLGHTIKVEDFRRDVVAAENNPSSVSAFLRYRLNVWVNAAATWIPDSEWQRGYREDLELTDEEIAEFTWTAGLDCSSTRDLSSFVLLGQNDSRSIAIPYAWCNEEMASQRQKEKVNYQGWASQGHIRITPGNVIDFNFIRRDIEEICKTYPVSKIAIDRWATPQLAQQLLDDGHEVYYHGQGYQHMSPAVKELERLVYSGELVHNSPLLRWAVSNCHVETDPAGNIKLSKKLSKDKIDPAVALAMAVGLTVHAQEESGYEQLARDRAARKAQEEENRITGQ